MGPHLGIPGRDRSIRTWISWILKILKTDMSSGLVLELIRSQNPQERICIYPLAMINSLLLNIAIETEGFPYLALSKNGDFP